VGRDKSYYREKAWSSKNHLMGVEGVGVKINHTIGEKHLPLKIIEYSLSFSNALSREFVERRRAISVIKLHAEACQHYT
jgi:hypothetical protein